MFSNIRIKREGMDREREREKDTNSSREVGGEIVKHQRKKNRQAEKQWQRESRYDER
jgi:hypothetical protein